MRRQVPPATNAAAAYAFLATAVKECSAMHACIKLLTDALKAEGSTPNQTHSTKAASYALNLSHAYEVLYDFDGAFQVLLDFCQRVGVQPYYVDSHDTYFPNLLYRILPMQLHLHVYPASQDTSWNQTRISR